MLDASKLMLSWTAPEGYATPQIIGDTIYSTKSQGGFSGTQWATDITAFDLQTGAIKWTHSGNNVFSVASRRRRWPRRLLWRHDVLWMFNSDT